MSKKSFTDNPAMAFIKPQVEAQDDTHENTQYYTQDDTQQAVLLKGYVRTQGRKGHKKPRINLAFDSDIFLDKVRIQADREGKSITQLVNEAVALYLENIKK